MKKKYDDDDGRTIADMRGLERPNMIMPQFGHPKNKNQTKAASDGNNTDLSREERRSYIGGALLAALLITAIFIVVFGVAIWLMLTVWR